MLTERDEKGETMEKKSAVSIAMEMGMAGEIKEQRENPILAIFCWDFFFFFQELTLPVEKSWQETGSLYSRKIVGMVFFPRFCLRW